MARDIRFTATCWNDYLYWQEQDRKTYERINILIRECQRDPFRGIGKPEPLQGEYKGFWSRRIDDANRLIYRVTTDYLEILSCRRHYDDH